MVEMNSIREEISLSCVSDLQKEIAQYKQLLEQYNITFHDLTYCYPQNEENRYDAIRVAKIISQHKNLATFFIEKKSVPVKELKKYISVSRKTISKYNTYIIAMTLVFIGEFTHINTYIKLF
jgi:RNA polymerase sigma factor